MALTKRCELSLLLCSVVLLCCYCVNGDEVAKIYEDSLENTRVLAKRQLGSVYSTSPIRIQENVQNGRVIQGNPTYPSRPTQRPGASYNPTNTQRPVPTHRPGASYNPTNTQRPVPTQRPGASYNPTNTQRPVPTQRPGASYNPTNTQRPVPTQRPGASYNPTNTQRPVTPQRPGASYNPTNAQRPVPTRPGAHQRPVSTRKPVPKKKTTTKPPGITGNISPTNCAEGYVASGDKCVPYIVGDVTPSSNRASPGDEDY